jgi:cell division transport system permease protein
MKFFFVLRQTFSNLWRERTPVFATILTICIALTILVALFEIAFVLYDQLQDLKSNMVVEVYLDPTVSDSQIKNIQSELEGYKTIERLRYVSKEKAAEIFKEEFGEDIMEILDENPLPVSFEVLLYRDYNKPDYLSQFKAQIQILPGVDEVHYRHAVIEKLENVTQAVAIGGIFVLIILVFAMNLLIRNTIKLSVYARRRQIDIMKILGAGNLFIRMPFILEGAIEGLAGGILSALCLIFSHKFIAISFPLININTHTYRLLWLLTVSVGVLIGLITSAGSVGRFVNKIFAKK